MLATALCGHRGIEQEPESRFEVSITTDRTGGRAGLEKSTN